MATCAGKCVQKCQGRTQMAILAMDQKVALSCFWKSCYKLGRDCPNLGRFGRYRANLGGNN